MSSLLKIEDKIENLPEYDSHRLLSFFFDKETGLKGFVAIHRGGIRHPAFGATRMWKYQNEDEALRDALKLSKTMSYKAALAGLKYGGAKSTIIINPSLTPSQRNKLVQAYANKINYFSGHFITGADVGTTEEDVRLMKKTSPYIVGVKVDPVKFTVKGVYYAIQVCLKNIFKSGSFENRTFSIQGLGKVGFGLLELIAPKSKKIYVADINEDRLKYVHAKYPRVEIVSTSTIDQMEVDVFSPCALSNCINGNNISKLRCKIIAGGANCQLEKSSIGELLFKLGILYAPDYVNNAGGLISVVDEYDYKAYDEERIFSKVRKIKKTLEAVISKSIRLNRATNIIADEMAKEISDNYK